MILMDIGLQNKLIINFIDLFKNKFYTSIV